eukprot:SAG22_NODE_1289_length_4854_cov_2.059937_6_plen_886_part_00
MGSVLHRILKRMQHAALIGSWNTWLDFMDEKKRENMIVKRVMARMLQGCMAAAFETWVEMILTMNNLKRLVSRLFHNTVASAFNAWQEHVEEQHRMGSVLHRILKRMQHAALIGSWNTWLDFMDQKKHEALIVRRIVTRMTQGCIASAFNTWRYGAEMNRGNERRYAQIIMMQARRRARLLIQNSFHQFRDLIVLLRRRNQRITRITLRFQRLALACCFCGWQSYARDQHKNSSILDRILRRIKQASYVAAWNGWVAFVDQRNNEAVIVRKVMMRMMQGCQSAAFETWKDLVRSMRGLRRLLKRMFQAQIVSAFNAWVMFVGQRNNEAVIVRKVMARMLSGCMASAFETWKDLVRTMRDLRRLLKRMFQAQIASAFNGWQNYVAEKRRTDLVLSRIIKRMTQASVVAAFNGWADVLVDRRNEAVIIRKVMMRMMQGCQSAAFETWKDLVRSMRGLRRLLGRMCFAQIVSAFNRWYDSAMAKKEFEQKAAVVVARLKTRMAITQLASVFGVWAAASAQRRRHGRLLAKHFGSKRRSTLRAVLSKWALYNVRAVKIRGRIATEHRDTLGEYVGRWWAYQDYVAGKVCRLRAADRHLRKRALRTALRTWVGFVKLSSQQGLVEEAGARQMRLVSHHMRQWRLSAGLRRWMTLSARASRNKLRLRMANSWWVHRQCAAAFGQVSRKPLPFCCASTVFLSKAVPFRAVYLSGQWRVRALAAQSLRTAITARGSFAAAVAALTKADSSLKFDSEWPARFGQGYDRPDNSEESRLRLLEPQLTAVGATLLRLLAEHEHSFHGHRAAAADAGNEVGRLEHQRQQVSCKPLPFCCASTVFLSKTVPFRAICLSGSTGRARGGRAPPPSGDRRERRRRPAGPGRLAGPRGGARPR